MYHKDMESWKQAIDLVVHVYEITSKYPKEELYGLVSQMRRAAVSIPSNIAEGSARSSKIETERFIDFALGSIAELETQMIISQRLGYLNSENIFDEIRKVNALVSGMKKYLANQTI